jgi:large subunit ribosomal protein L5
MAVPRITKITINSSFGKDTASKASGEREKVQKFILTDMALIAGQAPRLVKSKKSIAGFKLREGIRNRRHGNFAKTEDVGFYGTIHLLVASTIPRL